MIDTKTYPGKCALQGCDNCNASQHVHVIVTTQSSDGVWDCGRLHTLVSDLVPDDDEQGALMEGFVSSHQGPFTLGLLASDEEMAEMLPELHAAALAREAAEKSGSLDGIREFLRSMGVDVSDFPAEG